MNQTTNKDNIITYKNKDNIEKQANKQTKKFELGKVFRDGGLTGVITALAAHQGIIKTLVPISTYLSGHNAVKMGVNAGKLIERGEIFAGKILEFAAHGTITSTALLQWCALNPTLAATAIGAIVGAGGFLISATTRLIKSKKGHVEEPKKTKTR